MKDLGLTIRNGDCDGTTKQDGSMQQPKPPHRVANPAAAYCNAGFRVGTSSRQEDTDVVHNAKAGTDLIDPTTVDVSQHVTYHNQPPVARKRPRGYVDGC